MKSYRENDALQRLTDVLERRERVRNAQNQLGCYWLSLLIVLPVCLLLLWAWSPKTWALLLAFAYWQLPGWKLPIGFFIEFFVYLALPMVMYRCLGLFGWLLRTQRERERKNIVWLLGRLLLIFALLALALLLLKNGRL